MLTVSDILKKLAQDPGNPSDQGQAPVATPDATTMVSMPQAPDTITPEQMEYLQQSLLEAIGDDEEPEKGERQYTDPAGLPLENPPDLSKKQEPLDEDVSNVFRELEPGEELPSSKRQREQVKTLDLGPQVPPELSGGGVSSMPHAKTHKERGHAEVYEKRWPIG